MTHKPNAYQGTCCRCGCHVKAGEGYVYTKAGKREFGRWVTHDKHGRVVAWSHVVTCETHKGQPSW